MINGDFVKLKFYEMNQNETIKIDRSQLSYDKLSSVMDTLPKRRSQTVFWKLDRNAQTEPDPSHRFVKRIKWYFGIHSGTALRNIDSTEGILFNSPGTEIFPFSYFVFCLAKFSQVITDIQNLITSNKTRTNCSGFG